MVVRDEGERLRRERTFREQSTALNELNDRELIERYRFPRHGILQITALVKEDVERPTARSHAIPAFIQVQHMFSVCLCTHKRTQGIANNRKRFKTFHTFTVSYPSYIWSR